MSSPDGEDLVNGFFDSFQSVSFAPMPMLTAFGQSVLQQQPQRNISEIFVFARRPAP
jgi:hypothetical protein